MKLPRVLTDNHSGTLHPKAFRDSPKSLWRNEGAEHYVSGPTFIMKTEYWRCGYCGHSNDYYMLDCHYCGARKKGRPI